MWSDSGNSPATSFGLDSTLPWLNSRDVDSPGYDGGPDGPIAERFSGLLRYTHQGKIGTGGMAEVHRVWDHHIGRMVAMKLLHRRHCNRRGMNERFTSEALAVASLQHPCIIEIYDRGVFPDGRLYFTMPEVSGQTLSEAIRAELSAGNG